MAAFSVGGVGHEIKGAEAAQGETERIYLADGEVVMLKVGQHEKLKRAFAQRPVADNRGRYEIPAQSLRQHEASPLPSVQPRREIPQTAFASHGFVDRLDGEIQLAGRIHIHQKCRI